MPNPVITRRQFPRSIVAGGPCAAGVTFANAWGARVVTNGGAAPSAATKTAIAIFQCGLITDGLDTLMISWNAIAPDSLIASISPQLVGGGNDPWTNHNFVLADLTVNGLVGDFATKYLDTGLVANAAFPSDTNGGMTTYISFNGNNDGVFIGASTNVACTSQVATQESGGSKFLDIFNCNTGRTSVANTADGFLSGNRPAANAFALYQASSITPFATIASGAGAGATRPALPLYAYAMNINGVANVIGRMRMSFIAVHSGLTSAQAQNFYNRIQTLRTALGGGFV